MNRLNELKEEYKKQECILNKLKEEIEKESDTTLKEFLLMSFGHNFRKFEKFVSNNKYLCDFDPRALWTFYNYYPVDDTITSIEELSYFFKDKYIGKYDSLINFMKESLIDIFDERIEQIFDCINFNKLSETYFNFANYLYEDKYLFRL